jgi:hypothetical protein
MILTFSLRKIPKISLEMKLPQRRKNFSHAVAKLLINGSQSKALNLKLLVAESDLKPFYL